MLTDPAARSWPGRSREALPFLVCLVLYSVFLSRNLSIAHDSIAFLLGAVTGDLWHANHLLTLPLMAAFIETGAALRLPMTPLELATVPNLLCGAASVQIVFLFFRRRLNLSYSDSLLGCGLPAVSFGIWYYSAAIEAYAVPVFLMFLCIYLLADERRTGKTFLIVAVIHSLAALFHQFAVLLGPLVLYALYTAPAIDRRRKPALFAQYVLITALLVGGTNLLVAVVTRDIQNAPEFIAWLLGNAGAASSSQFVGGLEFNTILMALVGFSRALVGGHFVFAVPELKEVLSVAFGAQSLDDERFLVGTLSPAIARTLMVVALLWGMLLLTAMVRALRCLKDIGQSEPVVMVLWVFVPMTLVFTFYFGQNVELWLVQSVCFWIVLAWALARLRARRTQLVLLAGLLAINVFGSMQFAGDAGRDFHQWRLQPVLERFEPADLVVIGDWWPTAAFVEYFAGVEPLALSRSYQEKTDDAAVLDRVAERLANGGRVFVYDDVYHPDRSSVTYYGRGYVEFLERFRQGIPSAPPLDPESGRQHRLIANAAGPAFDGG